MDRSARGGRLTALGSALGGARGRRLGGALGSVVGGALGGAVAPSMCWGCSDLVRRGEILCAACRRSLHRLAPEPVVLSGVRVWAPVAYAGAARDLVRALKFRGALRVADFMAAQIVANAPPGALDGQTLVPVPLHPRRLRSRGYNQAAVLAEAVARRTGLELSDCLVRAGPAIAQVGRDRAGRRAGPAGSIEVRGSAPVASAAPPAGAAPLGAAPPAVVLVDDVVTTGATLAACRSALAAAGASEVAAVVFVRTLGR
jgi:predicted amidophosphoribosyltransferase